MKVMDLQKSDSSESVLERKRFLLLLLIGTINFMMHLITVATVFFLRVTAASLAILGCNILTLSLQPLDNNLRNIRLRRTSSLRAQMRGGDA
jgi:hypothetical protein